MVDCHFPLVDGAGNPAWLLRAAVDCVAGLVRSGTPTLIYCGAGMSRTPAVAAAALARVSGLPPAETLALVARSGAADVSPGLWRELHAVFVKPLAGVDRGSSNSCRTIAGREGIR